jgi:hypothetical protein
LKTQVPKGKHTLIDLKGPGLFLAGHVTKQGGATGLTFVELTIDGRNVVAHGFSALQNIGLTEQSPFGLVLLGSGGLQSYTFGWPVPLVYKRQLTLVVNVKETGVAQIVANIIRGTLA